MKRVLGFTVALVVLAAGIAAAGEGTEEFAKRLEKTTVYNCPSPIQMTLPSTYPLDSN